jgi:hypothetical protein
LRAFCCAFSLVLLLLIHTFWQNTFFALLFWLFSHRLLLQQQTLSLSLSLVKKLSWKCLSLALLDDGKSFLLAHIFFTFFFVFRDEKRESKEEIGKFLK